MICTVVSTGLCVRVNVCACRCVSVCVRVYTTPHIRAHKWHGVRLSVCSIERQSGEKMGFASSPTPWEGFRVGKRCLTMRVYVCVGDHVVCVIVFVCV